MPAFRLRGNITVFDHTNIFFEGEVNGVEKTTHRRTYLYNPSDLPPRSCHTDTAQNWHNLRQKMENQQRMTACFTRKDGRSW
ncbi:MAG: hypothetical protein ACWA5R_01860, partial [bacterium]